MDVRGSLISGDDDESQVFAPVGTDDLTILFRFSMNSKRPRSLPSRIVTCYYDVPAEVGETFADRSSMREALYSAVRKVWNHCAAHPSIRSPDVTIEIYEDPAGQVQWRVCHETSSYLQYLGTLQPTRNALDTEELNNIIDYQSLVVIEYLPGRGKVALVRTSWADNLFVYKGVDFATYLESRRDFKAIGDVFCHEISTIKSLPRHPNIISLPSFYVTAGKVDRNNNHSNNNKHPDSFCGVLYPFMEKGSLDDKIEGSNYTRLDLRSKARWCCQMSSAIHHTHFVACTYHMDIKPANFLLNTNEDLILIDWEQSGAPLYTLAPEADGSWDLNVQSQADAQDTRISPPPRLVYEKYIGPPRKNLAFGRPEWNVFPLWRKACPRALEAAETYSLGRTMWMVLEQVGQSAIEDAGDVATTWTAEDIPGDWKDIVNRCVESDPNKRIPLKELVDFWEGALGCNISGVEEAE